MNQLLSVDIDGDGDIEIFVPGINNSFISGATNVDMYLLDGTTGAIELTFTFPDDWDGQNMPAIADIDNDGFGEIILPNRSQYASTTNIYVFEHDGTLKYSTTINDAANNKTNDIQVADFNQDGAPEIYTRGIIIDGNTGNILIELYSGETASGAIQSYRYSVAVDILPDSFCSDCTGLELVIGNKVYAIDISTTDISLQIQAESFDVGFTHIVDWDLDGDLDVVVVNGAFGSLPYGIYVWDGQTPTILNSVNSFDDTLISKICIANLDDDPYPEIVHKSVNNLIAIDHNLSLLWMEEINENGLGMTVPTVFDFNGDDIWEVIHRDIVNIEIRSGETGALLYSAQCFSDTGYEMPIIADIDNDNEAELVCSCGTAFPSTIATLNQGYVLAIESAGNAWMPTRPVWNQHNYYSVNINDDLSVPIVQQGHHLSFPEGSNNYPLNIYGAQPSIQTDDLLFPSEQDFSISNISTNCQDNITSLTFDICSTIATTDNLSIAVYNDNPFLTAAISTYATTLALNTTDTNNCQAVNISFSPINTVSSLFLIINDDLSADTPYIGEQVFPITSLTECDYSNNFENIDVEAVETLILLSDSMSICEGTPLMLQATLANDTINILWSSSGDGSFDDVTITNPIYTPGFNDISTGAVLLTASVDSTSGVNISCAASSAGTIVSIDAIELPVFDIANNYCTENGASSVMLPTTSTNGITGAWQPDMVNSTSPNLQTYFFTPDEEQCTEVYSLDIVVENCNNRIVIPNAFSPNNDGINDIFRFRSIDAVSIEMWVFNRWGQSIYEAFITDFNHGWDGTFKGIEQEMGVYVYFANISFSDGTTELYKGNVTLIR